jgi:uncharacterized protein YecE (DUF72 family)
VGTASWTDRTLIESGWYPKGVDTPAERLRFYAERFSLVEVDATYYGLPGEQTAALWAGCTPAEFVFNIKAFSLFTGHRTRVRSLPVDLRPDVERLGKNTIYLRDVPDRVLDQVWERFRGALEPLRSTGKLGAVLLQFPPWFTMSRANKRYVLACADRLLPDYPACVEFRHHSWLCDDNRDETLALLSDHGLPLVCVDMPQGHSSSVPPVLAATAGLAVVRFHGHSENWTSTDIQERFRYRYSEKELREWAPRIRALAEHAETTHVLMNNCCGDYAQVNAQQLADLLDT